MTEEEKQKDRGSPPVTVTALELQELPQEEDDLEETGTNPRSTQGGQGILAAHQAERLRRGGSSYGEYKANQLETIAQTGARSEVIKIASGEAVRASNSFPYGLRNTLEDPTVLHADASEHRSRLAADADILEMAVDAAETIKADNSLEKMQAHQAALAHKMAMHFGALALQEKDVGRACKLEKASLAAMNSYRQGVDSIHRARRGGRQIVTVQRLNVSQGGQAVIAGQVNEPAA